MAGHDVLGRAQTGSGKTLAFGIPVAGQAGRQQEPPVPPACGDDRADPRAGQPGRQARSSPWPSRSGLKLVTVYGGTPYDKQTRQLRQRADIVVATPGRLEDLLENGYCFFDDIQLTVLDEADHLCDLGFYPSVDKLVGMTPEGSQRMLLSATLDGDVDKLVRTHLRNPQLHELDPNAGSVTTMTHHTLTVGGFREKVDAAVRLVEANGRTIIFTRTREGAVELAEALTNQGVDAVDLHGNLQPEGARAQPAPLLHRQGARPSSPPTSPPAASTSTTSTWSSTSTRPATPRPTCTAAAVRRAPAATARSSRSPRRSSCSRSCALQQSAGVEVLHHDIQTVPDHLSAKALAKSGSPAPEGLLVVVRREAHGRPQVAAATRAATPRRATAPAAATRAARRPRAARARAVRRRTARASPTPGSARPPRADQPRASEHAIASIVSPISTSSTCQARGRDSTGLSRRAP